MSFIEQNEIKIIAPHHLRGNAFAGNIIAGNVRKLLGKKFCLDLGREPNFFLHFQQLLFAFVQPRILNHLRRLSRDNCKQPLVIIVERSAVFLVIHSEDPLQFRLRHHRNAEQ